MDIDRIRRLLPEKPCNGIYRRFLGSGRHMESELGGEFLIFHRESITIEPDMSAEDWAAHEKATVRRWGAACFCTACKEEFIAGYVSNPILRGIALGQGPDGQMYEGYPFDEYGDTAWDMVIEIPEGEHIQCPLCDSYVQVLRKSDLRYGRTYQLAVVSVERIEQYTALITWLARRRIDENGFWEEDIRPRDALVIDENGRLQRFAHTRAGGSTFAAEVDLEKWEFRKNFHDSLQKKYYNFDSINHMLKGGVCYGNMPPIEGATGEKSGLDTYIENGGDSPQMYLKLWQTHPNVENLLKAGWIGLIQKAIDRHVNGSYTWGGRSISSTPPIDGIKWDEKAPHKMLSMTKAESKTLQAAFSDPKDFAEYVAWTKGPKKISASTFAECMQMFNGSQKMGALRGLYHDFGEEWALVPVLRYVRRHKEMPPHVVLETLMDYRRMYKARHPRRRKFTEQELWPVALRREHDVLAEQELIKTKENERKKYSEGFAKVIQKFGALEWTDGELCILLPKSNGDLFAEGSTLRHCVKGYGKAHIDGRDTIFFVRRYKRPERSYYTLDICMTSGDVPFEKQLHGYGNERHGEHLERSHRIPKKVREFVDRWKNEVLLPWAAEQKKAKKERKSA